ncbi:phage portal protein [Pseudomonas indica]|uniref:phage portal protein n=1 Tax=Pseudomonas indica TaxID=137658 RepID=UPI003FD5F665
MGIFTRKPPEAKLLEAAIQLAGQQMRPVAQGGGGGVETRWRGASRVLRSMVSWLPGLGSPRRDLSEPERKVLVGRSRDAYRNHLIGRAAILRNRTSVVGTGLICRPQVDWEALGITEEEGEQLNVLLDREWTLWAENPAECDAEATLNHYQLQALAFVSALLGGDSFAVTPTIDRPGTVYSTRVQLIETDRVSTPRGQIDSLTLVQGVEIDAYGAPVAFHICNGYPDEPLAGQQLKWDRIPAFGAETGRRRVLQIWSDKDRPGQKRGAPYLAPVLEPLQKLERYSSAELMAAVISAMFTVFLKKGSAFQPGTLQTQVFGQDQADAPVDDAGPVALGEGAVVDLAPGEEPMVANPARPNAQFDPFFMAIVKEIGAALEVPQEELLLFYSSSYSAARAAMLQAWRAYAMRRYWLVCDFCQPCYELVIDEAIARGRIRVSGYSDPARRRALTRAIWIGPARGAIDEYKEAQAAGKRIEIGVSNETIETAAMTGETWAQVFRQRAREVQMRREAGLMTEQAANQDATKTEPLELPQEDRQ